MRKITNSRGQEEERPWKKVQSNWSLITQGPKKQTWLPMFWLGHQILTLG